MAYKFQLGKAKLSGSIETAQAITSQGGLTVNGDVDLDAGVINNAELEHSSITVNGYSTDLGSSVTLDTDDVGEGSSNLYYTDARARAAVSVTDASGDGSLSYDSATGVITYTGPSASEVRAHLSAGDGLAFAGGQFAVTASIAGAGLAWNSGVLSVDTAEISAGLSGSVEAMVDAHLVGGTGITYSAGDISLDFSEFDSGDIVEGSNLFFTDARARAAVSATDAGGDGSFSYDSATGVFTYTGPSASETRKHLSAGDFVTFNTGSGIISIAAAAFTGSARNVVSAAPSGGLVYNAGTGRFALDAYAAGDGLSLFGTGSLRVNVDGSSLEINSDVLRVKGLGIQNSMLSGGIENAKLVNSSVTVVAGDALSGGGTVALGSSITLDVEVNGDALEISGDQIALKSSISGDRTFANNVTISGDLTVNGTTTYINTTNLVVEDALITVASGSAFAAGMGIELGTEHSLQTVAADAVVGNALSSSLPLIAPSVKASSFYGNLVGSMQLGIETKSTNATISKNVTRATANITLTLPTSPAVGQEHRVKCFVDDSSSPAVVVAAQVGATIEGAASLTLESYGAAVSLVWDGSDWMVF